MPRVGTLQGGSYTSLIDIAAARARLRRLSVRMPRVGTLQGGSYTSLIDIAAARARLRRLSVRMPRVPYRAAHTPAS